MEPYNRNQLKKLFESSSSIEIQRDSFPRLIHSTLNIKDDKLDYSISAGEELKILVTKKQHLIHFISQKAVDDNNWKISIDKRGNLKIFNTERKAMMVIHKDGYLSLNGANKNYKDKKLALKGVLSCDSVIGMKDSGYIDADGEWHETNIRSNKGAYLLKLMAHINDDIDCRYCLTYGIAKFEKGPRGIKKKVRQTSAVSRWLWGKTWNKIQFKWKIDEESRMKSYVLKIRTKTHYGLSDGDEPKKVYYRITSLI